MQPMRVRENMGNDSTKLVLGILAVAFVVFLSGCAGPGAQAGDAGGKLRVVASFYPLYDFTKNVGGDRIEVTALIPMGVEPHEFEPTASDIRRLSEADVFVYNGADMEPWVERTVQGAGNQDLLVVDTSEGIPLLEAAAEHHGAEEHHGGGYDPHIWLDPMLARVQVMNIRDALILADPDGKETYEQNAASYMAKLEGLDSKIRAVMSNCSKKEILITHSTLGYFCRRYGCIQIAISGVDPEAEPTPADLAAIIDQAKERNVSAVFFESMIDPRSARTICEELNGSVVAFNSVHGLTDEEMAAGADYISLMEGNLENIKKGLDCR